MITQFSKGFLNQRKEHAAFRRAVMEGDCNEIAIAASCSAGERGFVDAVVHASPRAIKADASMYRVPLADSPAPDTAEFVAELTEVSELAEMRDMKLSDLPESLPEGYRVVSPVLQRVVAMEERPAYGPTDYMKTKRRWENIQAGMFPTEMLDTAKRMTEIVTVRDSAAYVHNDDPLAPFVEMAKILFSEGFEIDAPETMTDASGFGRLARFAVYGLPFVLGVLGEVLKATGNVSFYHKWTEWYPRPEEAGPHYDLGYIPMAYPEGSPMHGSRNAMHSAAALALAYALLELFKSSRSKTVQFTGRSLEDSLQLLADNIGYFRVNAGVHYRSDHTSFIPVAQAIAKNIVERLLRPR